MKKLAKVLTCAAIMFIASACSGSKIQDDAITKLETGIKKATEMKSFDYAMDLTVDSENTTGKFYGTVTTEGGFQGSLVMDIAVNGVKADHFLEFYLKEDMMYVSMLGQKQKQTAGLSQIPDLSLDPDTISIDKEDMKKAFSEATLDGETLHLVLEKSLLEENKTKIDSAASSLATIDQIKDAVIDIEFENDFMKKVTMTIVSTIEGEEQEIVFVFTFDNINKVDTVTFPADLDTYVEAEDSMLSGIEGL